LLRQPTVPPADTSGALVGPERGNSQQKSLEFLGVAAILGLVVAGAITYYLRTKNQ